MEQIFLDQYTFEKMADVPLEGGILQWPSEIVKQLYSRYPDLAKVNIPYSLDYHHVNEKTLSAKGSVVHGLMEIPFIVDQGNLKPMLVYHLAGDPITTVMPITPAKILTVLSPPSPFGKKLTRKGKRTTPRINASTSAVVQLKTASLLDTLDGTVYEEDKKKLVEDIIEDPRLLAAMRTNETVPLLDKVSQLETMSEETLDLETEKDIYYIYKNAGLGYTKLSSNSTIYDPKIEVLQTVTEDTSLFKTSAKKKLIEMAKTANVSDTLSLGNGYFKIVELEDGKILLNTKGNYINNFEKDASFEYAAKEIQLPITHKVHKGDNVLIKTAENRYFGPLKIASVCSIKGKTHISGIHKLQKTSFVETGTLSKTIVDDKTNTYYTPYNEYIKLAAKENLKKLFQDFVKSSHTVAKRSGQYYLIGPEFEKLSMCSGNSNPFTKDEALWMLIQTGASEETVKQAEELPRGEFPVMDKLRAPMLKTRILEKTAEDLLFLRNYIDSNFKGLVKEASTSIADKN